MLLIGALILNYSPVSTAHLSQSNDANINIRELTKLSFSPDSHWLAAVSNDDKSFLLEISSENKVTLNGHESLTGVKFSPNGKKLAEIYKDFQVILWDISKEQFHNKRSGQTYFKAKNLVFSPDGTFLASSDQEPWIVIREVESGQIVRNLYGHTNAINGLIFSRSGEFLASWSQDTQIKLWDIRTGQEKINLIGPSGKNIVDAAFSPDGKLLGSITSDHDITLWDLKTGHIRFTVNDSELKPGVPLAWSPDSQFLVTGANKAQLIIREAATGKPYRKLVGNSNDSLGKVTFSPDGKMLLAVGQANVIYAWDIQAGKLKQTIDKQIDFSFSPDARLLASLSLENQIILWKIGSDSKNTHSVNPTFLVENKSIDLADQTKIVEDSGVQKFLSPKSLEVSNPKQIENSTKIIQIPPSGIVHLNSSKNITNEKPRKDSRKGITALAIDPAGTRLVSAGEDRKIRLLDIKSGKVLLTLSGHLAAVSGIAFSADGKRLISASRDSEVRSWDAATGKLSQRLLAHEQPIRAVASSPDGRFLASAGEETRIMIWDAALGKLIKIFNGHSDFVNGLAFSPDGKLLASGSADKRVLLWDVATGKLLHTLRGHSSAINSVAFNPKTGLLASGAADSQVRLWNTKTGLQIQLFQGHQAAVRAVTFSPDGQFLASAGEDGRILVWNLSNGKLSKVLPSETPINTLLFTPDSKSLIDGGEDNQITSWDVEQGTKKIDVLLIPDSAQILLPEDDNRLAAALEVSGALEWQNKTVSARMFRNETPSAWTSLVAGLLNWLVPPAKAAIPNPPGGPVLVITSAAAPFDSYYAEILRNEGLNSFTIAGLATVDTTLLNNHDLAILAPTALSAAQVTLLTDWVNSGGNLIAMRPDPQLASLLGVGMTGSSLANAYLLVESSQAPGSGLVHQTMQFHGDADRYSLNDATAIATLYSTATTATTHPAVTLRSVGTSGGQAAAFAYDLATSIVYSRQGNPAWAAQERDGYAPIRSDDKFYGNAIGDPQPDWVDLNKVAIPQADEQQRLLANLILEMTRDRKPLPRFWYFPGDEKAVVVMTGDDHGNNGTAGRFDQFKASSPAGCSVKDWECVRATSYLYPNTPLTDAQAAAYHADGFEIGLHVNTGCGDFTPASLEAFYTQQIGEWTAKFSSVPAPITQRHHCIVWSDWVSGAKVQLLNGIRLDTSYYYWPPGWVQNRPGFFNGSAMPMRFADLDGSLVDVYNAQTQMTDESGQQYPYTINTLLDRALGAEGYYGAFVINAHTDLPQIPESDAVLASALPRNVPIVSSKQLLDWLDFRNSSSFGSLSWSGNTLSFTVVPGVGGAQVPTDGLRVLLPVKSPAGLLAAVTRNGTPISFSNQTIKGVDYGAFPGVAGSYSATYAADNTAPSVTSTSPANGATNISQGSSVTVTFNEAMDASTLNSSTFELRNAGVLVPATISYSAGTRTASLTPAASLAPLTPYTVTVKGGTTDPRVKDLAGNALAGDSAWTFTTAAQPCASVPCGAWTSTILPGNPSVNDPNAVELGVKFSSDLDGFVTGVRFYQANPGTYSATLWSIGGQPLATGTVTAVGAGWQQVNFSAPAAVTANAVYVASYHAPNGNYAADNNYFASAGVDNAPIHLLRDGINGGNGVYAYGAGSVFPNNSYQASNYWVDIAFTTQVGPDTTAPTVTARSPAPGATGVAPTAVVMATFSEALDPSTVSASTFQLRDGNSALIAAAVNYDAATKTATLTPASSLAGNTVHSVTLKGGSTDPRIKDVAGNALAADLTWTFTTAAVDTTAPQLTAQSPQSGASGIAVNTSVTATFDEPLNATTVNTSTFELRDASTNLIAATVSYDANNRTATLTPSAALGHSTTYTVTLRGGSAEPRIKDVAGNALANNITWSFATAASTTGCTGTTSIWPTNPTPSTIADPDTSPVELGLKFRSTANGYICGIRFYKGSSNTGIHVGTLWSSSGQPLAQATFGNETASGWQQVDFAAPVAITANTMYIASYHAPAGRYSVNENYFVAGLTSGPLSVPSSAESNGNGVYLYGAGGFPTNSFQASNYWVDVVFTSSVGPDATPPTVTATSPASNAAEVDPASPVTVTFSEALDPATVNGATFVLRDSGGTPVAATVNFTGNTATLTPNSSLAANALHTATVTGGASGVKDLAGNPLAADRIWSFTTGADPCASGGNPIVCENAKPGNASSEWDISGTGDSSIQGFATAISVNRGETVRFKIESPATDYRLDIYRMGYYAGNGARKVATVQPSAALPQNQPACLDDPATGLIDCGNWAESASWSVPQDAVSGIYFAKAVREDGANAGKASHLVFVVRNDASTSDVLFQTADTTWQAYNTYGGNSFYAGSPVGRAYKLSYNRPFNTRGVDNGQDWLFNAEYPMVRWLEANGYHVSYFTGADSDRRGNLIANHKVFMSVGHDEYWSGAQRANVEAARNAGVHLAFFSGNEVFWKTRWENSIDGSGTPYRTLVCYKETHAGAKIDPLPNVWTGTWRDPRFSPPADGGRPENALTGTIFTVNDGATTSITVPAADGKMRFWRNTAIANLAPNGIATLPFGTLGYEWDEDLDNGFRPAGLIRLSTTTVNGAPVLQDYGSTFGSGTATHALTLYRHASGALVFGAGTVQWSWGLDGNHDRGSAAPDAAMQQATVNLLADMGAQPATLQPALVAATASTDTVPPVSTITAPTAGSTVQPASSVTLSGTANDAGGGVIGGIEVSVDGGASWRRANGRASWNYVWATPTATGTVTVKSRAVDDSGNLEAAGAGVTITVGASSDTEPPTAPAGLTATAVSGAQITLNWSASTDNVAVTGYRLERCQGTGCSDFTQIATPAATSFADSGLAAGTAYSYRVRAADAANNLSGYSAVVAATTQTTADTEPPTTPGGLAATAVGGTQINLSWTASTDNVAVTAYQLERCSGVGCSSFSPVATPTTTGFTDSGLAAGTTYRYRVRAVDAANNPSAYSAIAEATTPTASDTEPPTAPAALNATAASSAQINLTWTASTDNVGVTGYRVERCQGSGCSNFIQIATPTVTSFSDSGLAGGSTYRYRARASDAANNLSAYSAIAEATTQNTAAAPVAVTDLFLFRANVARTVNHAGAFGLGVLANDTNPANQALTAVAVGTVPTGVTLATAGSVTVNRSSSASFRYQANSNGQLSQPATGALVTLALNSAPATAVDNCTYVRAGNGGNGSISAGTACAMTATPRVFAMNLIANDTDPNATTSVPTDGAGKTVTAAVIASTGTGVAVSANSACNQSAIIKTASRATVTNHCDGTVTVAVAPLALASPITLTYRALDDLGAQSALRTNTVTVQ